jgi:hypothetical protein
MLMLANGNTAMDGRNDGALTVVSGSVPTAPCQVLAEGCATDAALLAIGQCVSNVANATGQ